jgi:mono/diheme cytochrome c family protein
MNQPRSLIRTISATLFLCTAWSLVALAWPEGHDATQKAKVAASTKEEGLAAWQQIYSVLTHPRCINCHTATNYPQQGDDRHRHFANVTRGPDGKGVPALQCITCHQEANADSTGVPGAHGWRLASLSMRWQDANDKILSSAEVCRTVTDRAKNNNLDGAGLLKHHSEEALVLWSFQPGRRIDGTMRTLPPLKADQFVEATRKWVEAGTPCPQAP